MMKKAPTPSKSTSRTTQDASSATKKSQQTLSSSRNRESGLTENSKLSKRISPKKSRDSASKLEKSKDSLGDITNLSFEPSVSDVDIKNYDIRLKSEPGFLYDEELYSIRKGGLSRADLEFSGELNTDKMTNREVMSLKKALNEAQARAISATKELSKIQYEKSVVENQMKKAENKCKELIEQKAADQARINELNYLNSQLNADMVKQKLESQNTGGKTRENLEKLRKNLIDVEEAIDKKNQKAMKSLKKLKTMVLTLEKLVQASGKDSYKKYKASFANLIDIVDKVSEIICTKNLEDLRHIEDSEDYEELKALNEVISTYETENSQLKSEISALKNQLSKEQVKNRDVIPQYRESVARLKKNTQLVRDKLRDIQELRQSEKEEFEAKIAALEESKRKAVDQNESLKSINKKLTRQLEESEEKNNINSAKLKKLAAENIKHSSVKKNPRHEDDLMEVLARKTFNTTKEVYNNYDDDVDIEDEEDEIDNRNIMKPKDLKLSVGRSASSKSAQGNIRRNLLPPYEADAHRKTPLTAGKPKYRSSHKQERVFDEDDDHRNIKVYSARKLQQEEPGESLRFSISGRTANWKVEDGVTEGRRTLKSKNRPTADEYEEEEEEEIDYKEAEGGLEEEEEENDVEFKKYLESYGSEGGQEFRAPVENLKNEIASLDDEIYEIQRCIKEELQS